ncbi:MAG: putative lipid II flippase FtsW [Clostridia bacterium]|nr:putative lipid II flippase FtsW [Clostridia bacterium]MBP3648493.1 putative lipid II flippase FtsW [Clostridia bacterium]
MLTQRQIINRRYLKRARTSVDSMMLAVLLMLLMGGILILFSATYYQALRKGDALLEVKRQLIGIALGAVLMLITCRIPYTFWRKRVVVLGSLGVSLILLILVIIPGVGVYLNGSRRWLNIAGMSFQPSEMAKIASVLFLAAALDERKNQLDKMLTGIVPLLVVPGIFFVLILEQPNLSTAGSIMIAAVLMLLIAGAKWKHLSLLGVCGLCLGMVYAWIEPYRRERLLSFRDPFAQMSDEGYQLAQSLIAIGSGGLFGRGLGQGRQKFSYLPYPESDFIFAIVGEDFGLLGCTVVILLFLAFAFAGMRIAVNCPHRYGSLLAAGLTAMITLQAVLNIAVVIGMMPTTGLPLPFFSAGGTSVSLLMASAGIILNVSKTHR